MVAYAVFSTGSISSYCTIEQVRALLAGYDLSRIGETQDVDDRIQALQPVSAQAVDRIAGHDFWWHADEQLTIDGPGTDRLSLAPRGIVPLAQVYKISISGQQVLADDYVVYPQIGEIRLKPSASIGSSFPAGLQNIELVVDWGYAEVPAEVSMAQAKLIAAQILSEAAGETSQTAAVRIGDYAVRYAREGKYGAVIERLAEEAHEALRPYRGIGMAVV